IASFYFPFTVTLIGNEIAGKQFNCILCKAHKRNGVETGIDDALHYSLILYIISDEPYSQHGPSKRDHFGTAFYHLPSARVKQLSFYALLILCHRKISLYLL